jgi:hypothetical protein
MPESKPKVYFHGKKMNFLEAYLCLYGLKAGIINLSLNEAEKEDYARWKKQKESANEIGEKLVGEEVFEKIGKKQYLVKRLEENISHTKNVKAMIYCKEHGHKEKKGSAYTSETLKGIVNKYTCSRCGMIYREGYFTEDDSNKSRHNNPFSN